MAQYILDEDRGGPGVPPGWCVVEHGSDDYYVLNGEETHAVQFIHSMRDGGACFALFARPGSGLVFNLQGWTINYDGGEQWLRGEIPDVFVSAAAAR